MARLKHDFTKEDPWRVFRIMSERVEPFPVILVGRDYWRGLIKWIKEVPTKKGAILKSELSIFTAINKPKEVADFIARFYRR